MSAYPGWMKRGAPSSSARPGRSRRFWLYGLAALICLASIGAGAAVGGYDLPWWSVDGGGGASTAAGFTLAGSVGQPDAGTLTGGGYTLSGGYFAATLEPGSIPGTIIYLPVLNR